MSFLELIAYIMENVSTGGFYDEAHVDFNEELYEELITMFLREAQRKNGKANLTRMAELEKEAVEAGFVVTFGPGEQYEDHWEAGQLTVELTDGGLFRFTWC